MNIYKYQQRNNPGSSSTLGWVLVACRLAGDNLQNDENKFGRNEIDQKQNVQQKC